MSQSISISKITLAWTINIIFVADHNFFFLSELSFSRLWTTGAVIGFKQRLFGWLDLNTHSIYSILHASTSNMSSCIWQLHLDRTWPAIISSRKTIIRLRRRRRIWHKGGRTREFPLEYGETAEFLKTESTAGEDGETEKFLETESTDWGSCCRTSPQFHVLRPLPRLAEMCDLRFRAFYGSLNLECRTRTGVEENGSWITRNCKSTPVVSNRRCKKTWFRVLLESSDGIYMILRAPNVNVYNAAVLTHIAA